MDDFDYQSVQEQMDIKEDLLDILEAYVAEWKVDHMYDRMEIMAGTIHEPLSLQMARAALEANGRMTCYTNAKTTRT